MRPASSAAPSGFPEGYEAWSSGCGKSAAGTKRRGESDRRDCVCRQKGVVDVAYSGQSWRDILVEYNRAPARNPLGLLPAWRLYEPRASLRVYSDLVEAYRLESVFRHAEQRLVLGLGEHHPRRVLLLGAFRPLNGFDSKRSRPCSSLDFVARLKTANRNFRSCSIVRQETGQLLGPTLPGRRSRMNRSQSRWDIAEGSAAFRGRRDHGSSLTTAQAGSSPSRHPFSYPLLLLARHASSEYLPGPLPKKKSQVKQ